MVNIFNMQFIERGIDPIPEKIVQQFLDLCEYCNRNKPHAVEKVVAEVNVSRAEYIFKKLQVRFKSPIFISVLQLADGKSL